jgi:hypothetical protein
MRFNQSQVLGFTGLSKEAMRHWKTALAPLSGRDGRSADFSLGELLALAALAEATRSLRIPISVITPVAEQFFKLVEEDVAAGRVPGPVSISGGQATRWQAAQSHEVQHATILIDFSLVTDNLRAGVGLPGRRRPRTQLELPL